MGRSIKGTDLPNLLHLLDVCSVALRYRADGDKLYRRIAEILPGRLPDTEHEFGGPEREPLPGPGVAMGGNCPSSCPIGQGPARPASYGCTIPVVEWG
jgi:hypothetical protein